MDELEFDEVLAARRLIYATLQTLFGGEPDAQLVQAVMPDVLVQAFDIVGLGPDAGGEAPSAAEELADDLAQLADVSFLEETRAAYVKLFVGPAELDAPPWESVYRSNSRALFQRSTLDVRNAYREQGLLPEQYPRVADDHIALELGFMAALAQRALDASTAGSEGDGALRGALEASGRFLDEHMRTWADAYCRDLAAAAEGTLYAPLAHVTAAFVEADAVLLSDLPARLQGAGFAD